MTVPFIPKTQESRVYRPRRPAPKGPITLVRNTISLEHAGQGGDVVSPAQAAWFDRTFAGVAGLRKVWDGEWECQGHASAAIVEARLSELADLRERSVQTTDPAGIAKILEARPASLRSEELLWLLRFFPGMESRRPRYATLLITTSGKPRTVAAYGVVYPSESEAAHSSEWLRAQVGTRCTAAPKRRDPAGRSIAGVLLSANARARLIDAAIALPGEAVEMFTAEWLLDKS